MDHVDKKQQKQIDALELHRAVNEELDKRQQAELEKLRRRTTFLVSILCIKFILLLVMLFGTHTVEIHLTITERDPFIRLGGTALKGTGITKIK